MRINAGTIIADKNVQTTGRILQFDFNPLGMRVVKRVDQRFPANSIHFIAEYGMERSPLTIYDYPKFHRLAGLIGRYQLLLDAEKACSRSSEAL